MVYYCLVELVIFGYWLLTDCLDRLLSLDIVKFRSVCLRTEIFLRELTLSSTLSSNPKSSHSVVPQFFHKLVFYVH